MLNNISQSHDASRSFSVTAVLLSCNYILLFLSYYFAYFVYDFLIIYTWVTKNDVTTTKTVMTIQCQKFLS